MGETTGFLKWDRETPDAAAGAGAPARLAGGLRAVPARQARARRPGAAWTAASRSATTAARSGTSSPTGTTSSTATTGATRSSGCTPPTTSPSSPAGCARRRARRRACSASTSRPGHDQAGRGRDRRPGVGRGLDRAASCPTVQTGKRVAVVGSGPPGSPPRSSSRAPVTTVVVFERADRIGGLLRYGIPEFKMEKRHLDRRLEQMRGRGHRVPRRTRTSASTSPSSELRAEFDAIVLAGGATAWRDLPIPGRELGGIYQAMEFLPLGQPGAGGRPRRAADHRRGQARRDHRRRRHRRRLPRHRRTARARRRSTSSRSCPARPTTRAPTQPVADVAERSSGCRPRTRRAASASTA